MVTLEEYTQPPRSNLSVRYLALALAQAAQKEIARLHRLYEQSIPPQLPPGRLIVTRRPDPEPPDDPPDDPPVFPPNADNRAKPPHDPTLPGGPHGPHGPEGPDDPTGPATPADPADSDNPSSDLPLDPADMPDDCAPAPDPSLPNDPDDSDAPEHRHSPDNSQGPGAATASAGPTDPGAPANPADAGLLSLADLTSPTRTAPARAVLAPRTPIPTLVTTVRRTSLFSTRTQWRSPLHPEFMRHRVVSSLSARVRTCPQSVRCMSANGHTVSTHAVRPPVSPQESPQVFSPWKPTSVLPALEPCLRPPPPAEYAILGTLGARGILGMPASAGGRTWSARHD
jgi:hypothetical protein